MDNVLDFAELKLRHMMREAVAAGDVDLAYQYAYALEQHQKGTVIVFFQDGQPYVRDPDPEPSEDALEDNT